MPEVDINDQLEKDSIRVPGQEYAIISVISPKSRQKADALAVKIKGIFPNMEAAKTHAAKLQKFDDTFDLFVVEMYSWLCLPPETHKIGEKHYGDEKLEELLSEHEKEMDEARDNFEQHKRDLKKAAKLKYKEEDTKEEDTKEEDTKEEDTKEEDTKEEDTKEE